MTTRLHLDIETLPALWLTPEQRLAYAYKKVPGNIKKPETKAKWLHANADEAWRKTSFDPMLGQLWLIGVAINDADPIVLGPQNADPSATQDDWTRWTVQSLHALEKSLMGIGGRATTVLVGKSIRDFDLPWLAVLAVHHGVERLAGHLFEVLAYPYDKRIEDIGEMWPTKKGKFAPRLDPMAQWLGVGGKLEGMQGSKVYDAYLAGEGERVAAYCAQDIVSTRECWRVLRGDRCPGGTRPVPELPEIPPEVLDAYGRLL